MCCALFGVLCVLCVCLFCMCACVFVRFVSINAMFAFVVRVRLRAFVCLCCFLLCDHAFMCVMRYCCVFGAFVVFVFGVAFCLCVCVLVVVLCVFVVCVCVFCCCCIVCDAVFKSVIRLMCCAIFLFGVRACFVLLDG